jgi:hypothetical protein
MNFFVKTERELEGCTILPILVVLLSGPPKEGTHLYFLLPHQVHAMSDSQRSNPIQQPQRPAQVRESFKQRIAMVTKKVIKAHESPHALLLYDASLQVVANSHSLTESVYRCNGGSHPVIGKFCDRGGLRIFFEAKWKPLYF